MPHLPTSPYFQTKALPRLLTLLSRWTLVAGLAFPLSACDAPRDNDDDEESESDSDDDNDDESSDGDDDNDDDSDSDDKSSDGDDDSGENDDDDSTTSDGEDDDSDSDDSGSNNSDDDSDSSTTGETDDDSDSDDSGSDDSGESKRDCSKIKWGAKLAKGSIIPRSEARGYLDTDGDHQADNSETDVDMCALHKSRAKCGFIVSGFYG